MLVSRSSTEEIDNRCISLFGSSSILHGNIERDIVIPIIIIVEVSKLVPWFFHLGIKGGFHVKSRCVHLFIIAFYCYIYLWDLHTQVIRFRRRGNIVEFPNSFLI